MGSIAHKLNIDHDIRARQVADLLVPATKAIETRDYPISVEQLESRHAIAAILTEVLASNGISHSAVARLTTVARRVAKAATGSKK